MRPIRLFANNIRITPRIYDDNVYPIKISVDKSSGGPFFGKINQSNRIELIVSSQEQLISVDKPTVVIRRQRIVNKIRYSLRTSRR